MYTHIYEKFVLSINWIFLRSVTRCWPMYLGNVWKLFSFYHNYMHTKYFSLIYQDTFGAYEIDTHSLKKAASLTFEVYRLRSWQVHAAASRDCWQTQNIISASKLLPGTYRLPLYSIMHELSGPMNILYVIISFTGYYIIHMHFMTQHIVREYKIFSPLPVRKNTSNIHFTHCRKIRSLLW